MKKTFLIEEDHHLTRFFVFFPGAEGAGSLEGIVFQLGFWQLLQIELGDNIWHGGSLKRFDKQRVY